MLIDIGQDGFGGLLPGISPQKLPGNAATIAANCDFYNGGLRPLKAPLFCLTPIKAGTKLAIYRFGQDISSDTQYFFHWLNDTDVVRGLIAGDTTERTYYTESGQVPKVTDSTLALSGGGTAYPIASYALGIPIPAVPPTLAVSGTGTGAATSRTYVYTYVSGWGEEGPPCAASAIVSVQPGQTVTLSAMSVAPAGAYNIVSKRIYRAISGTSSVGYQFVAEIAVVTTTYADSIADTALSGLIESAEWIPPPTNMVGLTGMRNGMMAGFVGQDIYFCEPFKPWAWPARYRVSLGFNIIGMKASGSSLIVTTKGNPYLITGSDPQSMDVVKMTSMQACVSKRSMVDMGDTVMFASPDGMVAANEAGAVLITEKLISQEEWKLFKPESILGAYHENKYIGFYNTGSVSGGFIIDFTSGSPRFSKIDTYATSAYNDLVRDALFLQVGNDIVKYGSGVSVTPLSLVARGNCVVTGNSVQKVGGATAYDSDVYSQSGFTGGAFCSAQAGQTNLELMFGLNSDPVLNSGFASIDYAILAHLDGIIYVYESNIFVNSFGAYTTTDVLSVTYDGARISYAKNGVEFRGVSATSGLTLYFDSSFNNPGAKLNNISFQSAKTLSLAWESKSFILPSPMNFSCARVDADSYPLTLKWYSDGVLKLTHSVLNAKPFRLPSGFRSRSVKVSVSGSANINKIYAASNISEMKSR